MIGQVSRRDILAGSAGMTLAAFAGPATVHANSRARKHGDLDLSNSKMLSDVYAKIYATTEEAEVHKYWTVHYYAYLHEGGKVDKNRVMVLRTASNYTMPPPGKSAADYLREEQHDSYAGLDAALENAYLVGSAVVEELLKNWKTYERTIPGSQ